MQPTFRHVPPNSLHFSTRAVFNPSWPERMAATYPPGPEPMITTSNFSMVYSQSEPNAWRQRSKNVAVKWQTVSRVAKGKRSRKQSQTARRHPFHEEVS